MTDVFMKELSYDSAIAFENKRRDITSLIKWDCMVKGLIFINNDLPLNVHIFYVYFTTIFKIKLKML